MRFSIITATFNSERYIKEAVESLLHQTYQDFEYIVVDGASNDSTLQILDAYKSSFGSRLTLVSETDSGIYDAFNKGIRIASGEIVGILNSDDWYEPDCLEKVHREFTRVGTEGVLVSGAVAKRTVTGALAYVQVKEDRDLSRKFWDSPVNHTATFVPLTEYRKVGQYSLAYPICSDYHLVLRLAESGCHFSYIKDRLVNMRVGGASSRFKSQKQMIHERAKIRRDLGCNPALILCLRFMESVRLLTRRLGRTVKSGLRHLSRTEV